MMVKVTNSRRRSGLASALLTQMGVRGWRFGAEIPSYRYEEAKTTVQCAEDTTLFSDFSVPGPSPTPGSRPFSDTPGLPPVPELNRQFDAGLYPCSRL